MYSINTWYNPSTTDYQLNFTPDETKEKKARQSQSSTFVELDYT